VSDYLMREMARIRTEDLRAEVAGARMAREVRASRGHGPGVGFLSGLMTSAGERVFGASRGTSGEACCA
jgi:hypothetical protein